MKTTKSELFELGAAPIDKNALAELRAAGDKPLWVSHGDQIVHEAQPPTQPIPEPDRKDLRKGGITNYTGTKKGWLTVVGYGYKSPNGSGTVRHKWVCRCTCGRYVYRTGMSLAKQKTNSTEGLEDSCPYCHDIQYKRMVEKARQAGFFPSGKPYKEGR